jgi:hypothetical protein
MAGLTWCCIVTQGLHHVTGLLFATQQETLLLDLAKSELLEDSEYR